MLKTKLTLKNMIWIKFNFKETELQKTWGIPPPIKTIHLGRPKAKN